MKMIYAALLGLFVTTSLYAQQSDLPTAFMLGENEKAYEKLTEDYSQSLLEASDNDITKAFEHWLDMMQAVDTYAEKIRFDIKGIRVWLHVFWNPDGSVAHIGYLLRPDSRNAETAELTAFFSSFARQYQFPVKSSKPFSHYTGATFPTLNVKAN
jgi:hypothetical protein